MIWSKEHWILLSQILRFCFKGQKHLRSLNVSSDETLGEFLTQFGFTENFLHNYLLPMGSAIWSMPTGKILDFPALNFLQFFKNHGLLSIFNRPRWQTVVGGSHSYVKKFEKSFSGKIEVNKDVKKIARELKGVKIEFQDGGFSEFDEVVCACHADKVLEILENPTKLEREVFSKWNYQSNEAILHTDEKIMPPKKVSWASWNYYSRKSESATLTYYMNKLQGLKSDVDYFVTLNCNEELDQNKILRRIRYSHPVYSKEAISTQKYWVDIQGVDKIYYCGSYWGHGFHEDASRSGAQIALMKGVPLC